MKRVQYKYKVNGKYKQRTDLMDLPKDEKGFILESSLSKMIENKLEIIDATAILIWHKIIW